ncbi:MAG: peptidase U32 family protein [Promethearchaeota archaeon]
MDKPELLSPCKNWKALKAATPYADAVYFGSHVLNLRQAADNFALSELSSVAKYCHERNIKAYLTLNAIIYDNEIDVLQDAMETAKSSEIDAVIVHDMAAVQAAKDVGIEFHMSTQSNISNYLAARYYEQLGAKRLILARELSINRIKDIAHKLTTAAVEIFVHGAMCTSISGRCYFSLDCMKSDAFSGNRGACTQPCRRKWRVIDEEDNEFIYNGQMFLNSKDLCMIEYIPQLIDTDARGFKIEGRMRDPYYVEVTSRCYREAIESYYENTYTEKKIKSWLKQLSRVFNRGFTTGFYFGRPTEKDVEHWTRGNVSKYRQIEVGWVNSYFREQMAAKIVLTNGRLRRHDEIFFMGRGSNTYFHQKIESLRIRGKDVTETPIATSKNHVLVSVKVNEPVKENDRVYIFTNETYENVRKNRPRKDRYKRY